MAGSEAGHDKRVGAPTVALPEIYIGFIFSARLSPPRIYTRLRIPLPSEMEAEMLDAIFLAAGLGFFALAIGYTLICERL